MTTEQESGPAPAQLPMAPNEIKLAALSEIDRLAGFIAGLSLDDWSKPSAAAGWTIGDVVTHLNLAQGLYRRLVSAARSGKGSGRIWKTLGEASKTLVPKTAPALNALNSALPRVIDRALSPEVIKGQFAASARGLRATVDKVEPADYTRPIYYLGGPWPLSSFLAGIVHELAIHGWDIESRLRPAAHLSPEACRVLPMFYLSAPFMLHAPAGTEGTVQAALHDPDEELWWKLSAAGSEQGVGRAENPTVTITGTCNAFVLTLAGRLTPDAAFENTSLETSGDRALAKAFLSAWRIV